LKKKVFVQKHPGASYELFATSKPEVGAKSFKSRFFSLNKCCQNTKLTIFFVAILGAII